MFVLICIRASCGLGLSSESEGSRAVHQCKTTTPEKMLVPLLEDLARREQPERHVAVRLNSGQQLIEISTVVLDISDIGIS